MKSEWRAQDVTGKVLAPLTAVGVDADANVEREAFEESAASGLLEGLREP